jgi:small GTP-binding protein
MVKKAAPLPTTLLEIRRLFDALDWTLLAQQVEAETRARLVIVGPVNSGKSTLFNTLKGRELSPVAAVPGTTRELVHEQLSPLILIDTPGFGEVDGVDRAGIALQGVQSADVVVLVLDAVAGVRQADYALLQQLRATGKPVVVALNKIDLLEGSQTAVVADARQKLGEPGLIPISAKRGTNVATLLLPQIIDAHPALAVALGRVLPTYRRQAAKRVIRSSAALNAAVGAEPIPGLAIPFLLAVQARMVMRIAAIYGESLGVEQARTLVATILGGVTLRYLTMEGAKIIPGPGWAVAAAISAAGTWGIGRVAVQYFEHGKRLRPEQIRIRDKRHRTGRQKALNVELTGRSGGKSG